jgi:hypothetical protein
MPRDFFQYLVEVCRVFVAAELAGGVNKTLRLFVLFRHTTFCTRQRCYSGLEGLIYITSTSHTTDGHSSWTTISA